MADRLLMTPGPTTVPDRVRQRMAQPAWNPDIDPEFVDFYRTLTGKLQRVFRTRNDVVILGGEGILGLEASVASIIRPGDSVLCISNGMYGDGFADFVELHGGNPVVCSGPYSEPIDVDRVARHLEENSFVAATMVHCETPTGVLNDLQEILDLCVESGVLTVVDAVSSVGGAPVPVDGIDICIAGSQKCLSSPPGLTPLSISDSAWDRVESVPQRSFYTSLAPWRGQPAADELLPYTHLVNNLQALDESVDVILEEGVENVIDRHRRIARQCRDRVRAGGGSLYPASEAICSPTVTAIRLDGAAKRVQRELARDHGVVVATGLGEMADDILRIGHMGANARAEHLERTMVSLEATLGWE